MVSAWDMHWAQGIQKITPDLHLVCQSLQAALTSHFSLASNRFVEVKDGKDPLGHTVHFPLLPLCFLKVSPGLFPAVYFLGLCPVLFEMTQLVGLPAVPSGSLVHSRMGFIVNFFLISILKYPFASFVPLPTCTTLNSSSPPSLLAALALHTAKEPVSWEFKSIFQEIDTIASFRVIAKRS